MIKVKTIYLLFLFGNKSRASLVSNNNCKNHNKCNNKQQVSSNKQREESSSERTLWEIFRGKYFFECNWVIDLLREWLLLNTLYNSLYINFSVLPHYFVLPQLWHEKFLSNLLTAGIRVGWEFYNFFARKFYKRSIRKVIF